DLLSRMVTDIQSFENFYVRVVAPPITALLVTLFSVVLVAQYDPRLALILCAFLVLAGVCLPFLSYILAGGLGRQQIETRAALNNALIDGIQGLDDILAYKIEAKQEKLIHSLGNDLARIQRHYARLAGLLTAGMSFLTNLGVGSVLVMAILLVNAGQLEGVYLAVLVLMVLASFEAVNGLPQAAQYLQENLLAARRLFSILAAEPEIVPPEHPKVAPTKPALTIRNLGFGYPVEAIQGLVFPRARSGLDLPFAISDLSFDLPPGRRLAIVGPSGSGKSTLTYLLMRFWAFDQGSITFGGEDIRQYDPQFIRSQIALVSQQTHLFNTSIRQNLLIARPEASTKDIIRAANQAQIHEFITALPDGYQTLIGERGLRLSAGERQRIAITRALLKGSPILFLDEPSANLDAITAREMMTSLLDLLGSRSLILITHHLETLTGMDEILVMHAGEIVERGTHLDLLGQKGFYAQMWEFQHQTLAEVFE
ncbi:MAG: thiol reductant ABC exporter subunit CydC, partial [Anaerolineales bacterium]|nr:thiol reductant ABC exporter subunit CydC [Anaerolineales bacterium]